MMGMNGPGGDGAGGGAADGRTRRSGRWTWRSRRRRAGGRRRWPGGGFGGRIRRTWRWRSRRRTRRTRRRPARDAAAPWDAPAWRPSATGAATGACSTTATLPSAWTTPRSDARSYSINGQETAKPAYAKGRGSFMLGGPLKIPKLLSGQKRHLHHQLLAGPHAQRHHQHADHAHAAGAHRRFLAVDRRAGSGDDLRSADRQSIPGQRDPHQPHQPGVAGVARSTIRIPTPRATSRTIRRPSPPSITATT